MGRICVIRQHAYPLDPRLRREVEALATAGHDVDVICLTRPGQRRRERIGRVVIYRLPLQHRRGSIARYLFEYAAFLVMAAGAAAALGLRHRYDVVQVNTMPDVLVYAGLVPRLLGARVVLDLYECMPEFYATKFGVGMRHPLVRLIAALEQASIRFADVALTCNELMRVSFMARGARPDTLTIVMNSADEETFDANRYPPRPRQADRFILVSHGSIEERYGLDTAIRAVALLQDEIPGLRLEIYGEGSDRQRLRDLVGGLNLQGRVSFSDGFVPIDDLLRAIAAADAGIVATKRDRFRDLIHCLKMFDFIAMERPAIVSRTPAVQEYFDDGCFQLFRSDDAEDLARAILELYRDPTLGERLVRQASRVNERYAWPRQRDVYLRIVAGLMRGRADLAPNTVEHLPSRSATSGVGEGSGQAGGAE